MGSFSWTRAEDTTKRANLTCGDKYKILVPIEFGGGYIVDMYFDYGYVFYKNNKNDFVGYYVDANGTVYSGKTITENDLYGILAYWNGIDNLQYESEERPTSMIRILVDGNTRLQKNRCAGISLDCSDNDTNELKYPLKLVSMSYRGSYEDCKGRSYGDPNQGFGKYYWTNSEYGKIIKFIRMAELSESTE